MEREGRPIQTSLRRLSGDATSMQQNPEEANSRSHQQTWAGHWNSLSDRKQRVINQDTVHAKQRHM